MEDLAWPCQRLPTQLSWTKSSFGGAGKPAQDSKRVGGRDAPVL